MASHDAEDDLPSCRQQALEELLCDTQRLIEDQMGRCGLLVAVISQAVQDKGALYEWVAGCVESLSVFAERVSRDVAAGPPGYRLLVAELVRLYDDSCRDVERLCASADRAAVARKVFLRSCALGGLAVVCSLYRQILGEDPVVPRDLSVACGATARMQMAIRDHVNQQKAKVAELETALMCRNTKMTQIRDAVRVLMADMCNLKRELAQQPVLQVDTSDRQALLEEVQREKKLVCELEAMLCRRCPLEVRKLRAPE
ncbi:uncharacterized protein LOC134542018 [Bacillus rossius redtenbacheri]|uniref:uncharacterized protein LOC134542018 n=1 Tax=Bacillus rossius redtenbacheri TaxID=93214 RepID=UPI002FDC970C